MTELGQTTCPAQWRSALERSGPGRGPAAAVRRTTRTGSGRPRAADRGEAIGDSRDKKCSSTAGPRATFGTREGFGWAIDHRLFRRPREDGPAAPRLSDALRPGVWPARG